MQPKTLARRLARNLVGAYNALSLILAGRTRPVVFLIRGLPGSGKSTLARLMAANTGMAHLEADQYFYRSGKYRFVPQQVPAAHADCRLRLEQNLRDGRSAVVSNTFSRRWEMDDYLEIASRYGARVIVLVCTGEYESLHAPPEVVPRMRERWED